MIWRNIFLGESSELKEHRWRPPKYIYFPGTKTVCWICLSTEYVSLIQKISEQAFEAPKTSVKINELGLQMQEITRQISPVIENLEGESKEFIGTIDELDQFIY